jgi:Fe2+ transport system protein B
MMDEARERGIEVNPEVLQETLGISVVPTVATRKKSLDQLFPSPQGSSKALSLLPILHSSRPGLRL